MRKLLPVATGKVAFWDEWEGWGEVEVPSRPGIGFVPFAFVAGKGYRHLDTGERVDVEWTEDSGRDGCQ